MPFNLTVRIEGQIGEPANFVPQDLTPVKVNDTVSWGNDTLEEHQPWPTDSHGNLLPGPPTPFLSNRIPAKSPSNFTWTVNVPAGTTIRYRCAVHPERNEVGSIEVVP
jgi:plastocyanin